MYFLIGLSLALVGVAGLQFIYLFFIDRIFRERKKYIRTLERRCSTLAARLESAECRVAHQKDILESIHPELGTIDEAWADLIEEG